MIFLITNEAAVFASDEFLTEIISGLEANSNYTYLFLTENLMILATRTLKEFEELLPSCIFLEHIILI